jgi:hypothetical protein
MSAQPWTGTRHTEETALPVEPNAPFWFMHHPATCWELVDFENESLWLPTFRRLFEMAGVNAVRMIPNGGVDSSLARVHMHDTGFEILDMELGYQTRYLTRSGAYFYVDIWSTPKVLGRRVLWNRDHDAYDAWRHQLLLDGVLLAADPDVLDIFIEQQERRVERNMQRSHIPHVKIQVETEHAKLDRMIKARDLLKLPKEAPKPARKTTRRRKKTDE